MTKDAKNKVKIFIDQKAYDSPDPTTGVDLYDLGNVRDGYVLHRDFPGDRKDKLIQIDRPSVNLKENEHFRTAKAPEKYFVITVNTDPIVVDHDVLNFDELVKIAYPEPPTGLDPAFTVSFEHAKSKPHHGDLAEGGTVTVKKHGTIFDVAHTNRS